MCFIWLQHLVCHVTQARAAFVIAKASFMANTLGSKAFIESQIPVLRSCPQMIQATAAKLTALEVFGIVAATVIALLLLKRLFAGNDSGVELTAHAADVTATPSSAALEVTQPSPAASLSCTADPSSTAAESPEIKRKLSAPRKPRDPSSSSLSKVDSGVIALLAIAGAAIDGIKPVARAAAGTGSGGSGGSSKSSASLYVSDAAVVVSGGRCEGENCVIYIQIGMGQF